MFARHKLVWLTDDGWRHALTDAAPMDRAAMAEWRLADWPAIVRRADVGIAPGQVCLGLALPPDPASGCKRRIALTMDAAHVKKIAPPIGINAVLHTVAPAWADGLTALQAQADKAAIPIGVYGACAMQALTGQRYLTPTSDIDLLWYPVTTAQLEIAIDLLRVHAATLPLDGEIVFPSGQAVAWKEWSNAAQHKTARVLAKAMDTVSLMKMQDLAATLDQPLDQNRA
jgi:phosphoribosyl-dephospho-CoA transferase